jgi:hypothetical protein
MTALPGTAIEMTKHARWLIVLFPCLCVAAHATLFAQAERPGRAAPQGTDPPAATPETRAVGFLAREVPRWFKENRCYSCHNNGDAARALYTALRLSYRVPEKALTDTSRWLARPEDWDHNGGEGPFSDKRLARIEFASALEAAVAAGQVEKRRALEKAAERLVADQAADGSWPIEDGASVGSPATYGRPLATLVAADVLRSADPARHAKPIERATRWLRGLKVRSVLDAAVVLRALAEAPGDATSATRRRECLDLLRRGQSPDGGWGPYVNDPPEPFDTAIVLLSLARLPEAAEIGALRDRGRAFLIANQSPDGSWSETTRPAGGESYAERISTSGWATLALLATRPERGSSGKVDPRGPND